MCSAVKQPHTRPISWRRLQPGLLVQLVVQPNLAVQGRVQHVDFRRKAVLLVDVYALRTGRKLDRRQRYFEDEISELEEVDESLAQREQPIIKTSRKNPHLKDLHHLDIPRLLAQKQFRLNCSLPLLPNEPGQPRLLPRISQDPCHMEGDLFKDRLNLEYRYIRNVCWPHSETPPSLKGVPDRVYYVWTTDDDDQAYRVAKSCLSESCLIGVSLEGQNLGRFGRLSLISVSIADAVFVFDCVTASSVLDSPDGLVRKLLESPRVVKVVHDCRRMSDLFEHQLGLRVENFYDTLAAYVVFAPFGVYTGFVPRYALSYNSLVRKYLGVATECLFFPHFRMSRYEEDTAIWVDRPLKHELLTGAALNCRYLLELRRLTRLCLHAPLLRITDALMASYRDANEAEKKPSTDDELPNGVLNVLPRLEPRPEAVGRLWLVEERRRFVHNVALQCDPLVIFSRDCLHQKKSFENE